MIPHRDRSFRRNPKIGHVRSESPFTLLRNHRSRSIGIVGHVAPETSVILVRNTQFARHGVETVFVRAPQGASAEDQLLVQFQGMIAEYERAQILERSRRGKRHRARAGEVSVLSGAPYGYRYIRKSEDAPASYAVLDSEARVVRRVFEMYTEEGLSIGE